jgi:hypothetical protein
MTISSETCSRWATLVVSLRVLGDNPLAFIAGSGNRHQICGKKDPVAAIG